FLSIQEGCDKFCTFCVVPYTRGAEYSRKSDDIITEAKNLVARGVMEITLLGQNVNAYHGSDANGNDVTLAGLVEQLANIDGLERIRYMTSHPIDMQDDLIAAHGNIAKLMPCLHLPVQSGSDNILARMNRKHKVSYYLEIIDKLRNARPDIAFSSDFIVGFPGESDADFQATLKLVETVGYAQAYSYSYSPRPGTPAADKEDQIEEHVKVERLAELQQLIVSRQTAFNIASVGRKMPILLDKQGKRQGQLLGKSPYMQSVHVFNAEQYAGQIVNVSITEAFPNSLAGEVE
ncbi:MAG: MiaB/RimO family radical SAM methylthiotransferase, partial [Pseudomonadota bacterium]